MEWNESDICKIKNIGVVEKYEDNGDKTKWFMSIEYYPYGYFKLEINYLRVDDNGDIEEIINEASVDLDCSVITMEHGKIKMNFNDNVLLLTQKQVDDISCFFNFVEGISE